MKTTLSLVVAAALLSLPSCTVHLGPDGSKSLSVDGAAFAETIQILSDK